LSVSETRGSVAAGQGIPGFRFAQSGVRFYASGDMLGFSAARPVDIIFALRSCLENCDA